MRARLGYLVALVLWCGAVWGWLVWAEALKQPARSLPATRLEWNDFFSRYLLPRLPIAEEFAPPLHAPDGAGVFITLPFLADDHLGEDWTTGSGQATLNQPVTSVADGWVEAAGDYENAWGKVVFICYRQGENRWPPYVEVMYAQLQTLNVQAGDWVKRGQLIGTVGDANGLYQAHLHWEIRQLAGLGLGPGFSTHRDGWMNPSDFLAAHRGSRAKFPLLPQMVPLEKVKKGNWGTDD